VLLYKFKKMNLLFIFLIGLDSLLIKFPYLEEGEAIFLKTGKQSILIDAGPVISGKSLLDFLKKEKIDTLSALIITHPHPDHYSGFFFIKDEIFIKNKFDNGDSLKGDYFRWFKRFFRDKNYRKLKAGDTLKFGNLKIKVLSPDKLGKNRNRNSLVLLINFGKTNMLFMGDADTLVERKILEKIKNTKINLLKLGHHGAGDVGSEKFLKNINPDFAIICVSENHPKGYPSKRTLERLKKLNIKYLLTEKGDVLIFIVKKNKLIKK